MNNSLLTNTLTGIICLIIISGCSSPYKKGSFGYDLDFLKKYKRITVLKRNSDRCQVILVGDYQGRVMTSTSNGLSGNSYGWINYDLISSGKIQPHINVFGGEDRFWLGPEGGQFSIFFKKGTSFDFKNWYTPSAIDTEPFELIEYTDTSALFNKKIRLVNYQDTEFNIEVTREVLLLSNRDIEKNLQISLGDDISCVAFQTKNGIKNIGESDWSKRTGLLSIWILGMFRPSDNTTVVIPYRGCLKLNTEYFGKIGEDRLKVKGQTIFFRGDGKYRCKIGVKPENCLPFFGSYDSERKILTVIQYSLSGDTTYVNSLWKYQEHPYRGDAINSYNDGPIDESGNQLGPFYELESSSCSRELRVGEEIKHTHTTYHFEGREEKLNQIAEKILGVGLKEIGLVFQN